MAATAGSEGYAQTLGAGAETIFLGPYAGLNPCTTIRVKVSATSPVAVKFKVVGLHSSGCTLAPGESELLRLDHGGVQTVTAEGNTGIISWYPVASTKE